MDANYADLENAPSLNLDYNAVMSSWEKMGGNISGDTCAAGGSGELPLDLSFLNDKGFGEDPSGRDPLDIFTFCDLFDANDLTFSTAPQQRRSPNGTHAAASASHAAGVVPGCASHASLNRASSDMMVPCCERAGSGALMPTFEQSGAVAPEYPTYEQYTYPQVAEQQRQQQQQQQQQPTYMTIYTPVMVQMTGPSPFASYAATPFAPYANAAPFTGPGMVMSEDGSGGANPFYHPSPLVASLHGCMPVSMSLIRAATGPIPSSPMMRQTSAPCSAVGLGRTNSAAYSERRSNGTMSNLSRAASGGVCNGADQGAHVGVAGAGYYEVQQGVQRQACRGVGGVRGCGRADGTAESCHHHTLNTSEPRTRAECLARYRSKKARRLHTKMIRYHLRKINADNRPRFKGRFVKKGEMLPPTVGEAITVDE